MTKLTLISILVNGKTITEFVQLPIVGGKTILPFKTLDELFMKRHRVPVNTGQTISIYNTSLRQWANN